MYQYPTHLTPKKVFHLRNVKVVETNEKTYKRKHAFAIISNDDKSEFVFSCTDETEKIQWVEAINANSHKSPSPPPDKEFIKKTKSAAMYMSGRLIDTMTDMGAGGKIMKEYITEDVFMIIQSLKNFVFQREGPEKADKLEKQSISTAVKMALVYKENHVTKEYFEEIKIPIRVLVSAVIDGYELPFSFATEEIIDALRGVQKYIEQTFRPFLPEKTMNKLREIFDYFCTNSIIEDFFEKRKWKECEVVAITLRKIWDESDGYF